MTQPLLALLCAGLAASACAAPDRVTVGSSASSSPPATGTPSASVGLPAGRDPAQRYEVTATVLQSPEHGPELCVGGVALSLPPQCGGPPVVPFSWDDVTGEESVNGTTWAEVRLVGTFDGVAFHPTERPATPTTASPAPEPSFPTPCQDPRVVDPAKSSDTDQDATIAHARSQPDVAGVWLSRPGGRLVLNLAFTGDLARHEREARARWGGGLCVTGHARSMAELERAQQAFSDARAEAMAAGVDMYGSGIDEVRNVVTVTLLIADDASRRWVDARFGAGTYELTGSFRPVA